MDTYSCTHLHVFLLNSKASKISITAPQSRKKRYNQKVRKRRWLRCREECSSSGLNPCIATPPESNPDSSIVTDSLSSPLSYGELTFIHSCMLTLISTNVEFLRNEGSNYSKGVVTVR